MAGNIGLPTKRAQNLSDKPVQQIGPKERTFLATPQVDVRELYFLIAHFLSSGPCKKAAEALKLEAAEFDLLPRRPHAFYSRTREASGLAGDNGRSVPMVFEEVAARHPSIGQKHLEGLLLQLMQTTAANQAALDSPLERTLTAADTNSILGTGLFSLLARDRASAKQGGIQTNLLRWPFHRAGPVRSLLLRDIWGGFPGVTNRLPARKAGEYALGDPSLLVERLQHLSTLRGHRNAIYCTVLDRSGRFVITGSDDFLVKIWSMTGAILLRTCRGHTGDITDLTVSVDNKYVASGSNDHSIRVWSLPFGVPISVLKGHANPVTGVQFSPRAGFEHHLLSASEDNTCRVWDARSSKTKPHVYSPKPAASAEKSKGAKEEILCASYNPDGRFFVTGSTDKLTRVWLAPEFADLRSGQGVPVHEVAALAGHENHVNYVQFSGCSIPVNPPTDAQGFRGRSFQVDPLAALIVSCSRDGSAIIWTPKRTHSKLTGWVKAHTLKVPEPPVPPPRHFPRQPLPTPRGVNMIVWSLDNRFVLAAIMDCRICVWNARDGSLVHSLTGHTQATYCLDVHPTDPRVALSAGYDGKLIVWDIWGGRALRTLQVNDLQLVDARFSPDGSAMIASNEVGEVYYFGTGTKEQCKGAQTDQFFLGDYLETVEDAEGYVMDLAMDIPAHVRNLQDPLCNAQMEPYPEPIQYAYQSQRIRAFGGVEALHGVGLPVPLVRMPTADVIFQAQAAAAQPLRHHVWTGHEDGPRLEPAPLAPPLPPATRQQVIWREDFEEEEGDPEDESGSASGSEEEGGTGRAFRRSQRPVSRRGRALSDGGGESSGRSYGRRASRAEAPSTSRFGRVLKRKRDEDYESLSEGREETTRRSNTRRQRPTLADDEEWQDDCASSSTSEGEEADAHAHAGPRRTRQHNVSKGKEPSQDSGDVLEIAEAVNIGGNPIGGRGDSPLFGWASKRKRGIHRGQAGPKKAEEGPAGPVEMLPPSLGGGSVSFHPMDGQQVARLGGFNNLVGVQLRTVVPQVGAGVSYAATDPGTTVEKGVVSLAGMGATQTPQPQVSAFGRTTEPTEALSPKPRISNAGVNASGDKPTKVKRLRVNPPKEKVGAQPLPPRQMPPPINEPKSSPPKQAKPLAGVQERENMQNDGILPQAEMLPRPESAAERRLAPTGGAKQLDSFALGGGASSPILAPPLHFLSPIKSAYPPLGQPPVAKAWGKGKDEGVLGKAKKAKQQKKGQVSEAQDTTLSETRPLSQLQRSAAYTEVFGGALAHNPQSTAPRNEGPANLSSFHSLSREGLLDVQNPQRNLSLQHPQSHQPDPQDPFGTLSFLNQLSSGHSNAAGPLYPSNAFASQLGAQPTAPFHVPAVSGPQWRPNAEQGLEHILQHLTELSRLPRGPVDPRAVPDLLARQQSPRESYSHGVPNTAYHNDPLLALGLQVPQGLAEHAMASGSGLQQEARYPNWMVRGMDRNGLGNDHFQRQ